MFKKLYSLRFIAIISLIIGILGSFGIVYASQQADGSVYRIAVDQRGNMRLLAPDLNGNFNDELKDSEFEIKLPSILLVGQLIDEAVADLQAALARLGTTLTGLADNISQLQETAAIQGEEIIELGDNITELQNTVSQQADDIAALWDKIAELEGNSGNPGNSDTIVSEGLVLWLPMDEGGGSTVYDESEFGNDGVITGATWVSLNSGYALNFDGIDDNILVPDNASFNITSTITFEVWIKAVSGTSESFLGLGDPDVRSGATFNLSDPGTDMAFLIRLGGRWRSSGVATVLSTTEFNHIVGVYDGSTVTLYQNGVSISSASFTGSITQGDESQVVIGANKSQRSNANCSIGEVRIYSRALSPMEIQQNYLATKLRYQ